MNDAPAWRRYLTFWRKPIAQDIDDELRFHTNMRIREFVARGMSEEQARQTVADRLGDLDAARAECIELGTMHERGVRRASVGDALRDDVRFAARQLRRSPGFAALAILTVALGIGANTAVFSIVHHVLLDPLPFPDGNRIVVFSTGPEREREKQFQFVFAVPTAAVRRLDAESRIVTNVSAVDAGAAVIGNASRADTVMRAAVSPAFLPMLGVQPAIGRAFNAGDAGHESSPVALISFRLWQDGFGGTSDALGKTVMVDGLARSIVGVTPPGLDIPIISRGNAPDVWIPLDVDSVDAVAMVFARLRPGQTSASAARELESFVAQTMQAAKYKGLTVYGSTALDWTPPEAQRAIEILFATVCGLLVIACANLANLLFMRGCVRQRELAIRRALGAGRSRLVRQLLTESIALSLLGGALGLFVAWIGLRLARGFDYVDGARIDRSVFGWTLVLSIATGLAFGVGPALWSAAGSTGDALRAGARGIAGSGAVRRVRSALIVGEIALSLCFLIAATLLVRSFVALESTPIGYDPHGLAVVRVRVAREPAKAARLAVDLEIEQAVRGVPGVEAAAIGPQPQTEVRPGPFSIDGPTGPQAVDLSVCEMPFVEPSYFRVTRIALVEGRTFGLLDDPGTSQELIVNQSLARRLWPNRDAIGAKLRVGKESHATWLTVVGVAHDLHLPGTTGDLFNLQMYRPASATPGFENTLLVRVRDPLAALEPSLDRAIGAVGIGATVASLESIETTLDNRVLARPRRALKVFAMFAIVALLLSAVGLYGVVAYSVTQRTREIGLRVALGADSFAVTRLVLGESGRLVAIGAALGLVVAYAATRSVRAFLYGVGPTDPIAFLAATIVLVMVTLAASLAPAWRALRINPTEALGTD